MTNGERQHCGRLIEALRRKLADAEQATRALTSENQQLRDEIDVLAPPSEETILSPEDEATAQRVRALLKDTVDKYDLAKQLDALRTALRRVQQEWRDAAFHLDDGSRITACALRARELRDHAAELDALLSASEGAEPPT